MDNSFNIGIEKAEKYIQDVTDGTRIAGALEKKAVLRHKKDLENSIEKGFYFSYKHARKAFAFFTLLKHSKGKFSGQPFVLSDWQAFVVYSIFGWLRPDGNRRFKYAYIEIARKNGKTTFAAALGMLMLVFDGEQGAEVYTAATKYKQAKICWDQAKNMNTKSKVFNKEIKAYQNRLVMESTLSFMEPLSRDSDKLDGLNPHAAFCDEYHAWKTDDLFNVIKSALGAREQPLVFIITTAGFNKTSPCFERRRVYLDVLDGIKIQENTFVLIFTLDENDDFKDQSNWGKSNPNINISVSNEYLQEEYKSAVNRGGPEMVNFKTKNLNLWVDAPDVWIKDDLILKCSFGTKEKDLIGQTCYDGLDLASHVDINAYARFYPDIKGKAVAKIYYFIPESKVIENEDRVDYKTWINEGRIFVTEGNVIDIDAQVEIITGLVENSDCRNLAFDPAKAYHGTIQGLQKNGVDEILDEYRQRITEMSEPTKYLQRLVEAAQIDLMDDPVLRWMFRNAVIYSDINDNIKLDKKKSVNKIDGLVALVNAIGGFLSGEKEKPYSDHSLRTVNL